MMANSLKPTLYFVIFSICLFLHPLLWRWKYFDDSHTGFSVLIENIFIVDEQNDRNCHFDKDTKWGFNDNQMGFSVLVWSLMVIDKKKTTRHSDNKKRLVVAVGRCWRSLCLELSLWWWYRMKYKWQTYGFERLDMKHNYHLWTKLQWDV